MKFQFAVLERRSEFCTDADGNRFECLLLTPVPAICRVSSSGKTRVDVRYLDSEVGPDREAALKNMQFRLHQHMQ